MPPWTCPNTKCTYDRQLDPQKRCPICGNEAEQFTFDELDQLWKQMWSLKKTLKKTEENERLLKRLKFCPKCGSNDVDFSAFYRPSIRKCHECGYQGPFILENGNVAEKIRKKRRQRRVKWNLKQNNMAVTPILNRYYLSSADYGRTEKAS